MQLYNYNFAVLNIHESNLQMSNQRCVPKMCAKDVIASFMFKDFKYGFTHKIK